MSTVADHEGRLPRPAAGTITSTAPATETGTDSTKSTGARRSRLDRRRNRSRPDDRGRREEQTAPPQESRPVGTTALVEAGGRPRPSTTSEAGTLTIAPGVVRTVARCAAEQVPEVLTDRQHGGRRVLVRTWTDPATAAGLRVRLEVTLRYPCDIRAAAWQVRERVVAEVGRITGISVLSVEVVVSGLRPETRRVR
ncbi:Asp23/Gls24 family envelope stress response protein [Actinoalloteichus hymeniacidonis]|uniref:Asp23/Gls24 family envelope stress response protein n=1 Tax=Actinoalloteichus hymeniacidonis TaxID=340345 RepID=A0AAC9HSK2_9PSEU|nr:Asp23/Gls24 family envelope stress response protein [Actinoalloteichus hymeniacidonis]AOS64887.1 hypothetical protein TL08_20480 [Actinoalloteichus hymeniacidonis]MBB5907038.1 putative alkaline shock family protein YloU [Actinoalloteichus hymeniacidonis]